MSSTSACDSSGVILLKRAVKAGCGEKVSRLLSQGVDVNEMCFGQLPLHVASEGTRDDQLSGNFLEVVKMLVEAGADVNEEVFEDKTPLMYACENGQSAIGSYLLKMGAEVNARDVYGNTPLLYALKSKPLKVSLISDLLKAGGSIECIECKGCLLHAILTIPDHFPDNYLEVVKVLVEAGADVNHVDKEEKMTPLMEACQNGHSAIGSYLLKMGAKVNACDYCGNTPLQHALTSNSLNVSLISDLLEAGASVNCSDGYGSPLHALLQDTGRCSENDTWDILELLLSYQCDMDAVEDGKELTALHMAIKNDDLKSARMLVQAGCNVNIEDSDGHTLLYYAICRERYHFVELLLAAGGRIPCQILSELESVDPSMLKWLLAVDAECPKLSNLCRRSFIDHYGIEAQRLIKKLPLSPYIKRYLSYEIL